MIRDMINPTSNDKSTRVRRDTQREMIQCSTKDVTTYLMYLHYIYMNKKKSFTILFSHLRNLKKFSNHFQNKMMIVLYTIYEPLSYFFSYLKGYFALTCNHYHFHDIELKTMHQVYEMIKDFYVRSFPMLIDVVIMFDNTYCIS